MPLPTRYKEEDKDKFVSRCISELAKKGEGDSHAQRVAICLRQSRASLSDEEIDALDTIMENQNE